MSEIANSTHMSAHVFGMSVHDRVGAQVRHPCGWSNEGAFFDDWRDGCDPVQAQLLNQEQNPGYRAHRLHLPTKQPREHAVPLPVSTMAGIALPTCLPFFS